MRTFASVLLPEPFGPMIAWISPLSTESVRPVRISFSPMFARRSRISRSLVITEFSLLSNFDDLWPRGLGPQQVFAARRSVDDAIELFDFLAEQELDGLAVRLAGQLRDLGGLVIRAAPVHEVDAVLFGAPGFQ